MSAWAMASSQASWAASSTAAGAIRRLITSSSLRCMRSTRVIGSRFSEYPAKGPMRAAVRAEVEYASPVMRAVMAAAHARPWSES